jgi:hypothetical protein
MSISAYLMAHNALRFRRPCIPFLEIVVSTLTRSGSCKVEEYSSNAAHARFLILAGNLSEEDELLRCRIGNGKEYTSA